MTEADRVIILLPVFNDWLSLSLLIPQLDETLVAHRFTAELVVVDDASTTEVDPGIVKAGLSAITSVGVVRLRRNLGHQRAIAVGLAFIHANAAEAPVVVMDADGEDKPSDVPLLLKKWRDERSVPIVFAERRKRTEGFIFRACYIMYRVVHRILTGHGVRVGNFSVLPWNAVSSLVAVSELWNHYAAAVVKARLPWVSVPTTRGHRLAGAPSMHFTALVVHGLSALSVFGDTVGVRVLIAALVLAALVVVGLATVLVVRVGTALAIPGWATYTGGLLLLALMQVSIIGFMITFAILSNRSAFTFMAVRDYQLFVKSFHVIAGA